MNDLMETFYSCASKILVEDILNRDGEYLSRMRYMDNEVKRLCKDLDEGTALRVDELLSEQVAIGEVRESACFRAGFRMGLELTR